MKFKIITCIVWSILKMGQVFSKIALKLICTTPSLSFFYPTLSLICSKLIWNFFLNAETKMESQQKPKDSRKIENFTYHFGLLYINTSLNVFVTFWESFGCERKWKSMRRKRGKPIFCRVYLFWKKCARTPSTQPLRHNILITICSDSSFTGTFLRGFSRLREPSPCPHHNSSPCFTPNSSPFLCS